MADQTSPWTYVNAWERAAKVLGVEIEGPARIELSPNTVVEAEMLVRGFGAPRGTLVFRITDSAPPFLGLIREQGFTASSFGPYRDGQECTLTEMLEVLGDWGWCGDSPDPAWLITIDAEAWLSPEDFYETVLSKLRAPPWHGHSLDALWDSITRGAINDLKPPYVLRIYNTDRFSPAMKVFMEMVETQFREAAKAGVPVALFVWP